MSFNNISQLPPGVEGVQSDWAINNLCRHMLKWIATLRERGRGLYLVSSY